MSNTTDPFTDIDAILNGADTVLRAPTDPLAHIVLTPDNPDPVMEIRYSLLRQMLHQINTLGEASTLLAQEIMALKERQNHTLPTPPSPELPERKRFMRDPRAPNLIAHNAHALMA